MFHENIVSVFTRKKRKDTIVTADTSCLMNNLVDNCAPHMIYLFSVYWAPQIITIVLYSLQIAYSSTEIERIVLFTHMNTWNLLYVL